MFKLNILKETVLVVVSILVVFPTNGFCTVQDELTNLQSQRNELSKQVIAGLVNGTMSVQDAQKLKNELDDVIKLETRLKRTPLHSSEQLKQISFVLLRTSSNIEKATHSSKIWLGIDSRNKILEQKISDALADGTISKKQAENFTKQLETLRSRASNSYPERGITFTEALALAIDMQRFNNDIDRTIARK
jgi:seryl-tRNA synthetase